MNLPTKPNGEPFTVLVADDHDTMRRGIVRMLQDEPNLKVIGECRNGQEAIEIARQEHPDLIIMDIRMPGINGLEATKFLKAELPTTPVLVHTAHDDTEYYMQALQAGAAHYVLKDQDEQEFTRAIEDVLAGDATIWPRVAETFLSRLDSQTKEAIDSEQPPEHIKRTWLKANEVIGQLSNREKDVLERLCALWTQQQIADDLHIELTTVKKHCRNLYDKMQVSGRLQAAIEGWAMGFGKPELVTFDIQTATARSSTRSGGSRTT